MDDISKSIILMRFKKLSLVFLFIIMQQIAKSNSLTDSVIVFNAGINGNNTADLLTRLYKDVLQRKPQLVVLMIGTNDMLNTRNMLSVKEYEKNYQELLTRFKEKAEVILMTIPPVNSSYINMRKPELKFSENGPQKKVDSANIAIRKLAAKNKCHLVDLDKILKGCGGSAEKEGLFQNEANSGIADGVHPHCQWLSCNRNCSLSNHICIETRS